MAKKIPSNLNSKKVFETEEEAIKVLELEGRKLKYCAIKVWRSYMQSYQPSKYAEHLTGQDGVRTKRALQSIKLGKVKKYSKDEFSIEVTFVNKLAYHDSVFGREYPQGHAIMLISSGWKVKRGWHKKIKHFGYYRGFDYLGKVQKMYDGMRDNRVSLEIQWLGSDNYTK